MSDNDPSGLPAPKVRPARGGDLRAELIVVGSDLLSGEVGDSSAQIVAGMLTRRGFEVRRITVVADDVEAIAGAIRDCLDRKTHVVTTIGGLGPAVDDRTLEGVGEALILPLVAQPLAREMVDRAYARLQEQRRASHGGINAVREKMTLLPVGCAVVENEAGIAPGTVCRIPGAAAVVSVPGTPREARSVFEGALPYLKDFGPGRITARRQIEAPMPDESDLVPLIRRLEEEFPDARLSTRPVGSQKKGFRLLASVEVSGHTIQEAESRIGQIVHRLLALAASGR